MRKYDLIALAVFILVIMGIYSLGNGSGGVVGDERTYTESWRLPNAGSEFREIGIAIVRNGIKVCGEYYVKEIMTNEYVIACSANGVTWNYFVVYPKTGKIFSANSEMINKLTPPR